MEEKAKSSVMVLISAMVLLLLSSSPEMCNGLGVNWGTQASHMLPPATVVQMLKDNGITKVKLFDAEKETMSALAASGLEVMVAIPNDQLESLQSRSRAKDWVRKSVTNYHFDGGVNIK